MTSPTIPEMNIPLVNTTAANNSVSDNYTEFQVVPFMSPDLLHSYYTEDYVVISLYIPVIVSALTANIIIILVVFRDHYMRR